MSKSQRLELPFIFNKSPAGLVLRDFNEYSCCFFFKCYATKQDLFKLGWRIVGKHKQQNLSNNVLKALYFEDWPSYLRLSLGYLILGWTIVTPQGHYGSSSHVMLQAPLESGTFQDSTASVLDALTHPTMMISNSTDFSYFKNQLTKHLKTKARARLLP